MSEPRILASSESVELVESQDVKGFFADGVGSAIFGSGVAKLSFFEAEPPAGIHVPGETVVSANRGKERRVVTLRVTIPTLQLLEFCVHSVERFQEIREQLLGGVSQEEKRMVELLDRLVRRG